MKRILLIALTLISIQVIAQERREAHRKGDQKEHTQMMKNLTPEQAANLKTKKMTLLLDLTDAQQKEIYKLHLANAKERKLKTEELKKFKENNEKPSQEERYNLMNERLDKQIAMKRKIKSILSEEQYKKFEHGAKQQKMRGKKAAKTRSK